MRVSLEVGSLSQIGSSLNLNITLQLGSAFRKQLGVIVSKSLSEERYVKGLEFTAFCTSEMTASNSKYDNLDQPMLLYKQDFTMRIKRSQVAPTHVECSGILTCPMSSTSDLAVYSSDSIAFCKISAPAIKDLALLLCKCEGMP